LFQSTKTKKPITRQQAYRIIHDAAVAVGIQGKIGTNSMRKTFGFHAYKRGVAISLLQKHFHHATPSETFKYLGISKDENLRTEIDVNL
jgi:site-specific recombinase XerD